MCLCMLSALVVCILHFSLFLFLSQLAILSYTHLIYVYIVSLCLFHPSPAQADALYEHAHVTQSSLSNYLVHTINNENVESTLAECIGVVRKASRGSQWIATGESL